MRVKILVLAFVFTLVSLPTIALADRTPQLLSGIAKDSFEYLDQETQSNVRGKELSSAGAARNWCLRRIGRVSQTITCSFIKLDRETWLARHVFVNRRGQTRTAARSY